MRVRLEQPTNFSFIWEVSFAQSVKTLYSKAFTPQKFKLELFDDLKFNESLPVLALIDEPK